MMHTNLFTDKQEQEIFELLLTLDSNTRVYLGCDSVRVKRKGKSYAKYATVCIVHKNSSSGCKIFHNISYEPDYDVKKNRPKMRMMHEVMKTCQLGIQLLPLIDGFVVEIHLDISTNPMNGSNCAAKEAAGYVIGMLGIEPKLKPESFAASFGADAIANGPNK